MTILLKVYSADTTSFANEQIETVPVTKAELNGGRERRKEGRTKRRKGAWKIERIK